VLVVAAHAGVPGLQGGFVGVDVFFVLSGYLITALLVTEHAATGRVDLPAFYARRMRRLLPALLAMLVVAGVAAALLLAPMEQREQAATAATAATWTSNLLFTLVDIGYFDPAAEGNWFLHTWSLGVEEQFYLVWPALVLALARGSAAGAGRRLVLGLLATAIGGLLLEVWATGTHPQAAFYQMPARAWQFALGALVWLAGRGAAPSRWPDRALVALGALGLVLIVAAANLLDAARHAYPGWAALLPSLGAACVLASGARTAAAGTGRWLALAPLPAIGQVSYAWYLWHWPVLLAVAAVTDRPSVVAIAVGVALSLALAVASRRWIEAPFRHRGGPVRDAARTLGVAVFAMVLVAGAALAWRSASVRWAQAPDQARFRAASDDIAPVYRLGCDSPPADARVRPCIFGSGGATHTAVLWGDSIGTQWFPAAVQVFTQPGWRLVVLTKSACPIVDAPLFSSQFGRDFAECAQWRADAAGWLREQRPDVVLVGSSDAYRLAPAQWEGGTRQVLEAVAPAAGHVFVFAATPSLPFAGPACLSRRERQGRFGRLECAAAATDERAAVREALARAAAGQRNVAVLGFDDAVCPDRRCAAERDGRVVFRDHAHLTAAFAATLAPEFERRLRAHGWDPDAPPTSTPP
jgi:peptidoglycan/LPS O-acetylase OafA/YrhL